MLFSLYKYMSVNPESQKHLLQGELHNALDDGRVLHRLYSSSDFTVFLSRFVNHIFSKLKKTNLLQFYVPEPSD